MTGRRRWFGLWLAALVVVVLVAAVTAGLARRDRETSAGDPSPSVAVASDATTPDDSVAPPPLDTPDPSSSPAEQPTTAPAAGAGTSFATFRRHASRAIDEGAALLTTLRAAGEAFDIGAVRAASRDLSAWAEGESAWLDGHPPRACYARLHARYASAIDDFGQAAAITERFAADFPFADFDDLQRALDLANAGAASMQAAVDLLPSVSCQS